MDRPTDVDGIRAYLDREADLADHVARVRPDDDAADHAIAVRVEGELGHAIGRAVGDGAARGRPREFRDFDLAAVRLRRVLGDADPRDLGVRIPKDRQIAPVFSPCESRTSDSRNIPMICSAVQVFRAIPCSFQSPK